MQPQPGASPWMSYAIPLLVVIVVMALRWRRMSRARRLRLGTLWILPAVYGAMIVAVFANAPPARLGWLLSALALLVGAGFGWQRGRMMKIIVDPETHALSQQASPAAFLLLIALVAVRGAARAAFVGNPSGHGLSHGALLATDVAMAFAFGLIAATRIEMGFRARRLLAEARRGFV